MPQVDQHNHNYDKDCCELATHSNSKQTNDARPTSQAATRQKKLQAGSMMALLQCHQDKTRAAMVTVQRARSQLYEE